MRRKKHPGGKISRPLDIEMDNRQRMKVSGLVLGAVLSSAYAAVFDALYDIEVALVAFPPPQWERTA